jgi:phage gp36-like protein
VSRYASWEDLIKRYPNAAKASANADMDEAYISPAEAEVDLRLSAVNTVPFTAPVPAMIQSLTIDVAYYKLTMRSKESKSLQEYLYGKDGIFAALLAGRIKIDTTTLGNSAWIDKEYHSRFGVDDPINWSIDSDAVVDITDERYP